MFVSPGGNGNPASSNPPLITTNDPYTSLYQSAGSQYGVPWQILANQGYIESGYNPNAVSPSGAQGLAQFMPSTWPGYGSGSPFNPSSAITAQAKYDASLYHQFGSWQNALAAYNGGPGNVTGAPEQAYATSILKGSNPGGPAGAASGSSSSSSTPSTPAWMTTLLGWLGIASSGVMADIERLGLILFGAVIVIVGLIMTVDGKTVQQATMTAVRVAAH